MGNQIAKADAFKSVINDPSFRNQIKASVKENAGAFMASMLDLYNGSTDLQACDPMAVANECLKGAVLNLPIVKALGFAYVVPYKGKPTFTIGYKGLIQLAQRTGQYRIINADLVYDGELQSRNKLKGEIDLSGEKLNNNVIGYFAHIELMSGFSKTLYMSKQEVDDWAKKYSPSRSSKYSPWQTEFDKMALKTVLRRLISTYGAMTTEIFKALETDDKGVTPAQEIKENANQGVIIDMDTDDLPVEQGDEELEHERLLQEALEAENMNEEADF